MLPNGSENLELVSLSIITSVRTQYCRSYIHFESCQCCAGEIAISGWESIRKMRGSRGILGQYLGFGTSLGIHKVPLYRYTSQGYSQLGSKKLAVWDHPLFVAYRDALNLGKCEVATQVHAHWAMPWNWEAPCYPTWYVLEGWGHQLI